MQEVFEKIKERLEESGKAIYREPTVEDPPMCSLIPTGEKDILVSKAIEIVNQVAEEYVADTNVGNSWKTVYDKVLKLEKEYAMSGDIENVNDCIRLQNLMQYFKEELQEGYNNSWIPCSERLPRISEQVMVCNRFGSVFTSHITYLNPKVDRYGECHDFGSHYGVIAWQPLPEPYKGE